MTTTRRVASSDRMGEGGGVIFVELF
jgi:hypothetical protein